MLFHATLFFSGIEKASNARILGEQRACGMLSFLKYSPDLLASCVTSGIPQLVMDSGAYSKKLSHQDIERYAAVICATHQHIHWFAAPDCLGDQARSNANYAYLLSLLPPDLHQKILWIYQYGADLALLQEGLQQHRRIGVGGLKPLFEREHPDVACQRVTLLARQIEAAGVVPHYFSVTRKGMLQRLQAIHQEFSVDSTTWQVGGRYHQEIQPSGAQVRRSDLDGAELNKRNVRTMLGWMQSTPVIHHRYQQLAIL